MLKYLIIQLADDSISMCHYPKGTGSRIISYADLEKALYIALQYNLSVQFIYPDRELPKDIRKLIDTIIHIDITDSTRDGDIQFIDLNDLGTVLKSVVKGNYGLRLSKSELFKNGENISLLLKKVTRLNIIITDIDKFSGEDFYKYDSFLSTLTQVVKNEILDNHQVQLNLLTDRMMLDEMNNCNAGHESITLAPDGKFYICPAFYLDGSESVGDVESGLDIKNPQLYRLDHAPICRKCDAYQCRRCVWLNKKTTLEVNTPSREQCVVAHIERNASKILLDSIRELGEFMPDKSIDEIDYLDPFDIINKN